jgi:predicted lipid-binding transport protein (Tim44 family)
MQQTHTISFTIPTAKILVIGAGLLAGVIIGAGLGYAALHHIELYVPLSLFPGYLARQPQAPARPRLVASQPQAIARAHAALAAAAAVDQHPAVKRVPQIHPAVAAFDAVPAPVRAALDQLVEHVLAEKYRTAA